MVSKGLKRPAAAAAAEAKKRRTECVAVVMALKEARDVPANVAHLLSNLTPHCLAVYSDERHEFQVKAVDMVGNALTQQEQFLKATADEAAAKVAGRGAEKAARESAVIENADCLAAKKGEAAYKEAAIVRAELKFRNAKQELVACQKALQVPEREHKEATAKQMKLQQILDEKVLPLKAASASNKQIQELIKSLKKFAVDDSLLSTLASVLNKDPAERGEFGSLTMDNLVTALEAKVQTLVGGVEANAPQVATCTAAVQAAQVAFDAAKDALQKSKDALKDATKEIHSAQANFDQRCIRMTTFDQEMKEAEAEATRTDRNLGAFRSGPMQAYASLKAMTAPPPPPVEEQPDEEPREVQERPAA